MSRSAFVGRIQFFVYNMCPDQTKFSPCRTDIYGTGRDRLSVYMGQDVIGYLYTYMGQDVIDYLYIRTGRDRLSVYMGQDVIGYLYIWDRT